MKGILNYLKTIKVIDIIKVIQHIMQQKYYPKKQKEEQNITK